MTYLGGVDHGALAGGMGSARWSWAQAEPLIAPLQRIVVVTRQDGAHTMRVKAFATIN